jgi:hypothetical protein
MMTRWQRFGLVLVIYGIHSLPVVFDVRGVTILLVLLVGLNLFLENGGGK